MSNATGHRDASGDGKVIHLVLGASIACKTKGANRQASPRPKDVNCVKCLAIVKRIRG